MIDVLEKTLVLGGAKPKRVRLRATRKSLETTTWSGSAAPKTTKKTFEKPDEAATAFHKAVRAKLRDDYVCISDAKEPGDVVFEAFARGGGGGAVLDMSQDGSLIVTASITQEQNFGAKLELVEVASGARHIVFDEPGGQTQNFLHAACFDREGKNIYFVMRDHTYNLNLATGERTLVARGGGFNSFVVHPSFDRDRRRFVVFAEDTLVRVLEDGKSILDVPTRSATSECRAAKISPSGRVLAVYNVSRGIIYNHEDALKDLTNEVQLWDIEAGVLWETLTVDHKLHRVGLTPDDTALLVTCDYAQGPIALEVPTGHELWRFTDENELALTFDWAYSYDGARLAIAGYQLRVLDAKTRVQQHALAGLGRASCPVFSRDGTRLAVDCNSTAVIQAL